MKRSEKDKSLGIKAWAKEDQPREKLEAVGRANLTNAELVAILLGSGSRSESAVSLAQRILAAYNNNLKTFAQCSISDLKKFKGVGTAKAISIVAAMELARRKQAENVQEETVIGSSRDAYNAIVHKLSDLKIELFYILLLNNANKIIKTVKISSGGTSATVVDPKVVLKHAVDVMATGIILAHNHPSGNMKASNSDLQLTTKIKNACALFDIRLLDHIIVGLENYLSFSDENLL